MRYPLMLLLAAFACLLASGCALCSNDEDYTYGAYGGRWQRHDRVHGRVGSVFAPAGGRVDEVPVEGSPETLPPGAAEDEAYYTETDAQPEMNIEAPQLAQPEILQDTRR